MTPEFLEGIGTLFRLLSDPSISYINPRLQYGKCEHTTFAIAFANMSRTSGRSSTGFVLSKKTREHWSMIRIARS